VGPLDRRLRLQEIEIASDRGRRGAQASRQVLDRSLFLGQEKAPDLGLALDGGEWFLGHIANNLQLFSQFNQKTPKFLRFPKIPA
jgi:hypothetical protein